MGSWKAWFLGAGERNAPRRKAGSWTLRILHCGVLWQGTGLHAAATMLYQQNLGVGVRVMSCCIYRCRWDYGYQTTAMANRTIIVDNNTWNTSHIATVGRAMASSGRSRVRQGPQICIMRDSHTWNMCQLQRPLAVCNMPCTVHMQLTASPVRTDT